MAVLKKIAGLVAGASAVAVIGVAVAQGVPPNPFIANIAQAAGQQSTHLTPMGETGQLWGAEPRVATAEITPVPQVAAAPEPAPVVAEAPAPVIVEQQQMGAAPAPEQPAPVVAKADRG